MDDRDAREVLNEINMKLAKCFFACRIPFRTVENPHFRAFVDVCIRARIPYTPPCRKTLANSLLNRANEVSLNEKFRYLNGQFGVLKADGWKNKAPNKKLLVTSVRTLHIKQAYLSYRDFSMIPENAVNLGQALQEMINYGYERFNCRIYAAVTDSDRKIVNAAERARTVDNEPLITVTCNSHSGNLLIQSFVDPEQNVKLRAIVNHFKDPGMEGLLLQSGGSRLQNYPEIRFCYLRDSILTVMANWHHLREICLMHVPDDHQVRRIILTDAEFFDWMDRTRRNLNPICHLIDRCQDPACNIAEATELWLRLRLEDRAYDDLITNRIAVAIRPPGYLANILHPVYQGIGLSEEQRRIGIDYLHVAFGEETVEEFEQYRPNFEEFRGIAENSDDAISFWTIMGLRFPHLSECAVKLLLIPASTAQLEGLFSMWAFLHDKPRNRLGDERSSQCLDMYYASKNYLLDENMAHWLMLEADN